MSTGLALGIFAIVVSIIFSLLLFITILILLDSEDEV